MHRLTDNNEVHLVPFDARWKATLVFYDDPLGESESGRTIEVVHPRPDDTLGMLWAKAEQDGLW